MNEAKEHIILTSFKLFLNKGYKEVSMSMIVKETGMSKGALYHYFKNKQELFIETVDSIYLSVIPFKEEMLVNPDVSFYDYMQMYIDKVKSISRVIYNYLGNQVLCMGNLRLMLDVANYAPELKVKIEETKYNELAFFKEIIKIGISKGEIRADLDGELLAFQFQSIQQGIITNSIFTDTMNLLHVNLERVLNQFYNLIKK